MASSIFRISDKQVFRRRLFSYVRSFKTFAILDSNNYFEEEKEGEKPFYHEYDLLAGIGVKEFFSANAGNVFADLHSWKQNGGGWAFGYFGYDLKNEIEKLVSKHHDGIGLPDSMFFRPKIRLALKGDSLEIEGDDPEAIWKEISGTAEIRNEKQDHSPVFTPRMAKPDYIDAVNAIHNHIIEGDVYEVNLCQEFYAKTHIDPYYLFRQVSAHTPQPFSAFLRFGDKYVMCASMERFLKKKERKLLSQPIKGTIRRGKTAEEDRQLQEQLAGDEKERAENVMIVDLVRNDLSHSSIPGTVQVEELCKVYPYPFVHQMISTVSSILLGEVSSLDAIKNAFPMGSMTGAPKLAAMQIIEKYEQSLRGIYSGAIGYFTPDDDFDLNVVIRTFVYNSAEKYLSIHAGSAITYDSDPEKEYEECLLKIRGLLSAIGGGIGQPGKR
jgi:para-aminobenzoate synthetase component 1